MTDHRRKQKNQVNYLRKKIPVGGYFIDCNTHPAICTDKLFYSSTAARDLSCNEVIGKSLISGNTCSCSLIHCGPTPITKKLAEEMVEYRKTHTYVEYMVWTHQGTTPEYWEEMDKVWNFSKQDEPAE
jgi:hypothetical protein